MPSTRATRVMVKIPMGYGRHRMLDRGQVFELEGMPNDDRLLKLGHIVEVDKNTETYECPECGASFVGMGYRTSHAMRAHPSRELSEEDIEQLEDREQKMLETEFKAGTLVNLQAG